MKLSRDPNLEALNERFICAFVVTSPGYIRGASNFNYKEVKEFMARGMKTVLDQFYDFIREHGGHDYTDAFFLPVQARQNGERRYNILNPRFLDSMSKMAERAARQGGLSAEAALSTPGMDIPEALELQSVQAPKSHLALQGSKIPALPEFEEP